MGKKNRPSRSWRGPLFGLITGRRSDLAAIRQGDAYAIVRIVGSGVMVVLETRRSRRLNMRAVFENGTGKAITDAASFLTEASRK